MPRAPCRTGLRPASRPGCPARASANRPSSGRRFPAAKWCACSPAWSRLRSRKAPDWRAVAPQDLARLLRIDVHLPHQRGQVGKFFFVAQLGDEFDAQATTVEVAIEVEQMRFEQWLGSEHGRARAQARHAGMLALPHALDPGGEDAGKRRALALQAQVGGGESQPPAKLAAMHDLAFQRITTAEAFGDAVEVTRGE